MLKRRTRLLLTSLAILTLSTGAACGTREPLKTVSDVSCSAFSPISYAQLPKGKTDDPGNVADSDETVKAIDNHNVRWDTLCTSPIARPDPPG